MRHETLVGNPHGQDPEKKPGNKAHAQIFNWNEEFAKLSPEEQKEFAPVIEQLRTAQKAHEQQRPSKLAEAERQMNHEKANEVREEIHKAPTTPRHPVRLDLQAPTPEQIAEWKAEAAAKQAAAKKDKGFWSGIKNLFN